MTDPNPFLRYLALGWSVIPVRLGTKIPQADLLPEIPDPDKEGKTKRSWKPYQERHPTREEVEAWGAQRTNVAVVVGRLSGIFVLDLDSTEAIAAAGRRGLPRTATARSSKGPHLYFRHPGGRVRNYRDHVEKWDLKGDGGLVNAPPSVHPTGAVYEWELTPEEVGVAEAPDWLLEIIREQQEREEQTASPPPEADQPALTVQEIEHEAARRRALYFEKAVAEELDRLRRAGEGSRNHELNRVAYTLGQVLGAHEQEAGHTNGPTYAGQFEESVLQDLLNAAIATGLSRREASLTIASGVKAGKKKPRRLPDFVASVREVAVRTKGGTRHKTTEEGNNPTAQERKKSKPSEANLLIALGLEATLFHTPTGERYARYRVGTRHDTSQVSHPKSPFRLWLHRRFYKTYGEPPGQNALTQALQHLEQVALYDGDKREVFTRIGAVEDVVYINVGDEAGHIMKVGASGWEILRDAPVIFRTTRNGEPLPLPRPGGSIDLLRPFVNVVDEATWKLCIGWMVGALNPWGPYAHIAPSGEQGTGKSTLLRVLRAFTDPAKAEENTDPKTIDDFMVTTLNNHVVSYDNLSSLPDWLSDGLCRIATGAGLTKRMLYSDLDEIVIDAARPAILNGISDIIGRPDLLERTITFEMPRIDPANRLTERAFVHQLAQVAPLIFGALLDGVVMALRRQDEVQLPRLPRLADFVTWVEAASPAFGWKVDTFLKAFEQNVLNKEENALEADEVAQTMVAWVHGGLDRVGEAVQLTMKELLADLSKLRLAGNDREAAERNEIITQKLSPDWPESPRALLSRLARARPILRKFGIEYRRSHHTRKGQIYTVVKSGAYQESGGSATRAGEHA